MTDSTRADPEYRRGVLCILGASTLWAFGYLFRKTILSEIHPVLLNFYNSAAVVVFLLLYLRLRPADLLQTFRRDPLRLTALAFLGVVCGASFMFMALDRLDLSLALVLEKLQPIFIVIIARFALGEHLPRHKLPFAAVALVSSYFVASDAPESLGLGKTDLAGVIYTVLAALSWAGASVLGRQIMCRESRPEVIATLRFLITVVLLSPALLVFDSRTPLSNPHVVGVIIFTAIFSTALGFVLFYRGLRHVSASVSGFIELVTPVVGIALGIILLGESLEWTQAAAIPFLLYAVYRLC